MNSYVMAIDQGTTSSRALIFDSRRQVVGLGQEEFPQHFPASGWVEHDPEDIWQSVVRSGRAAIEKAGIAASDIAAIGITNQRETTLIWDRRTGEPIHPAIVWQDRRTAGSCEKLRRAGHEKLFARKTGLVIDPYFSATKLAWLLDHVPGARRRARRGELAFGTVDTYLIWRLTGGKVHATDATNACRTLLFNIHKQDWDDDLLAILDIPRTLLPEVRDCAADFGVAEKGTFGADISIRGVARDQQAATNGPACFTPRKMK
jgi:glycerol kinase